MLKQARAAISLLNPGEVRARAQRTVHVGLIAHTPDTFAAMERLFLPADLPHEARLPLLAYLHRADDADAPERVDLVLYEKGFSCPEGSYTFDPDDPAATIAQIAHDHHDNLALALARQFPILRKPVVDRIVHTVARENAMFAVATALPNVAPNVLEVPWALGEFASDTAFLTINQIRMAFLIAAAYGRRAGFAEQKTEMAAIGAGAFGWRALARELVGHIPLGGGLIPKGAIAYAGTYVAGKGLEHFYERDTALTRSEHKDLYQEGYARGRAVTHWGLQKVEPNRPVWRVQ